MTVTKYICTKPAKVIYMKYLISAEERRQLIQEVGVCGLVLYEFYLRLASMDNTEITDEGACDYFGWNIYTAKRWRLELIKKGWLAVDKLKSSKGKRAVVYYLGKDNVAKRSSGQLI